MSRRSCSAIASFRPTTKSLYDFTRGSMKRLSRAGSAYISYSSTIDALFSKTKHTSSIGF